MKIRILSLVMTFAIFSILLAGCCTTRTVDYKSQVYVPVYKNLTEVRNAVKVESGTPLKNTGKIYVYDSYIFVGEKGEGIHIIDNRNPSAPQNIAFISIPGTGDMAVKNNILYADSYLDLLAFDISNPSSPKLVKRVNDIFPNPLDLTGSYVDAEKGLLVEWLAKDTVYRYTYKDCGDGNSTAPVDRAYDGGGIKTTDGSVGSPNTSGSGSKTGKGGSMARFTIYSNYLYAVDRTSLQTFDIQNPSDPKAWAKINIGWNIETIYPFKDKLFIGSTTGMFIYDASTAWNPTLIGQFTHARSCDPVVADDKYAYVTLRAGTACGGIQNQLDIIDITSLTSPKLIKSYPMQEPYGLGIDNGTLFICDGKAGLKVFDATNPGNIQLQSWKSDMNTYDIIPLGNIAIMVAKDGLYEYDYKDPKNLILLSKIPIQN